MSCQEPVRNFHHRRVLLNKRPPLVRTSSPSLVAPQTLHHKSSNNSLKSLHNRKPKKCVRFRDNESLENVRLFLKTQMPKACRSDPAYPKQYTYRLRRPNWPPSGRSAAGTVRIEDIQLDNSRSQIALVGSVQVANLAFEKHVVVRYTFDDWTTVHEVDGTYREPVANSANTWDRFCFKIELDKKRQHYHQTLDLAIKYTVGGRVFWDNNDHRNYQVEVVPDVQLDDLSSSSDDDDDNTFEDCVDHSEELLIEQIRPLTLKEKPLSFGNRYGFERAHQESFKPLSPPLSPTTPVDMNPLWSVPANNEFSRLPANNYFVRNNKKEPAEATSPAISPTLEFHSLVRKYCFYNDPKRASIYTPYHSDSPRCSSPSTPKAIHS